MTEHDEPNPAAAIARTLRSRGRDCDALAKQYEAENPNHAAVLRAMGRAYYESANLVMRRMLA